MDTLKIVDSNIWIFGEYEPAPEHSMAAGRLQTVIQEGYGINIIIVSETFHILGRLVGAADATRRVKNIIEHPAAHWLPFAAQSAVKALALAYQYGVRINDALLAQQALEQGCPILTDNVKDFQKVKGLDIIPLR